MKSNINRGFTMNFIKTKILVLFIIGGFLMSCGSEYQEKGSAEYIKSVKEWHNERVESLKTKSIWLKLAGLHWIEEGENTFGSSTDNKLIFPNNTKDFMGKIIREGDKLTLVVNDGVEITVDDKPVTELELADDMTGKPTVMKYKNYWWYVIKRGGDRFGIRLIDDEHPNLKSFTGIPTFPINEDWNIKGKWVPYNPVRTIEIPSVIGTASVDSCYGAIIFNKDGKEYKLHAAGKDKELFIIYTDATSGVETYGAGRFAVAEVNYENNEVVIDFNKSTNPPCSMSKYATCPLPPDGNRLKLRVTAGERFEGHH